MSGPATNMRLPAHSRPKQPWGMIAASPMMLPEDGANHGRGISQYSTERSHPQRAVDCFAYGQRRPTHLGSLSGASAGCPQGIG